MYEAFYGLREKPFVLHPDPYFIYWSESHRMAYSMLEYGVINSIGFTVITGDIGSGKTTLLRQLLAQIDQSVDVGFLTSTSFTDTELLQWIMMSFGQEFENRSKVRLFHDFQKFLIDNYAARRRVILIIDEAQNLDTATLEELRMLSNINSDGVQLLQTILVGQPQLRDLLHDPQLTQFSQRIGSDFHITSLSVEESEQYIEHRGALAGATEPLFTSEAARLIGSAGNGIPRVINLLCDAALVYGFAIGSKMISADTAKAVIKDKLSGGSYSVTAGLRPYGSQNQHRLLKFSDKS
jgi:general secretion pathway protein A